MAFFVGPILVGYLLAAGWIIWTLVGMWIMREITFGELAIYGGCYLACAFGAIAAWGTPLGVGLLFLGAASVVGYPIIQKAHNTALIQQMQLADLHEHLRRIDERPEIPYSYEKVADIYFDRGQFEQALEFYARRTKLGEDPAAKWRIKKCEDEIRRAKTGEKQCIHCGTENPREARVCQKCGEQFATAYDLLEPFRGKRALTFILWTLVSSLAAAVILSILQMLNTFWLALFLVSALTCFVTYLYCRLGR